MNIPTYASLSVLLFSAFILPPSFASEIADKDAIRTISVNPVQVPLDGFFSEEMRSTLKREVMSKPGVMLNMADMTDSGYTWTNDVVWVGTGLPVNENWYIAGFLFERPGHKSVWLQYAFTLSKTTGELTKFKRWYGRSTFR